MGNLLSTNFDGHTLARPCFDKSSADTDIAKIMHSYAGLTVSPWSHNHVGFSNAYVGIITSYAGLFISYVGLGNSYLGPIFLISTAGMNV